MRDDGFLPVVSPLMFYAVVPTAAWVARMVKAGATTVQLRNKDLSGDDLYHEIRQSVAACKNSQTQLFINDYWQQAIDAGAYGVHLGQEDLDTADLTAIRQAGLRLGVSTHSISELDRALSVKPSYVACGAIFATTTKVMPTKPQGLDNLHDYVQHVKTKSLVPNTPVVAIGGIDLTNAKDVLKTGVSSLAVVRAVTNSENPEKTVQDFLALWQQDVAIARG